MAPAATLNYAAATSTDCPGFSGNLKAHGLSGQDAGATPPPEADGHGHQTGDRQTDRGRFGNHREDAGAQVQDGPGRIGAGVDPPRAAEWSRLCS